MALTLQQVLKQLDVDEPNYAVLAALGPDALPHLAVLVAGDDPAVASKAAYLASLIQSDDAITVLASAAASPNESVRVAAATGLRNVPTSQALPWADRLLDDADVGVRRQALRSVARLGMETLEPKVKVMASRDAVPALRQLAKQELKRITDLRAAAVKESAGAPAKARKPRAAGRRTARGK